jgi:hypothetical protein
MPTDAKCGLLVGVGVVLTVAVLFFQKDPPAAPPPSPVPVAARSPAAVKPPVAEAVRPRDSTPAPAHPVSRTAEGDPLDPRLP